MIKRAIIFCVATLCLTGCSISENKAKKVATEFLTAFFEMDYEAIGAYCSGDLAAELVETISDVDIPNEEMSQMVREASKQTTFYIKSVDTKSEKGVATVQYTIVPFASEAEIERSMLLVKDNGEWRVIQLF